MQRANEVRQKYREYRPHELLDLQLPASNTEFLRLDHAFDDTAVIQSASLPATSRRSVIAGFEFDELDGVTFAAAASGSKRVHYEDGLLVFDSVDDRVLTADLPEGFDASRAVEVHIRARLRKGWELRLGWRGADGKSGNYVSLAGSPGNRFRIYEIDAKSLFASFPDANVSQLTLQCPGPVNLNDRLEVDYIRVFDTPSILQVRAAGIGRFVIDQENRPVLIALPGTEIQFPVEWPQDGRVVFSAGVASTHTDNQLAVTLETYDHGHTVRLTKLDIEPGSGWQDHRTEFRIPSGVDPTLRLRIDGQNGIALLSSPLLYRPEPRPRRVLFLVQDALRADHVSAYGAQRATSPASVRFAKRGALFCRALAQAPATRMSVASFFTSLHPAAIGVRTFNEVLDDEYVTLAEILRHNGWETVSITENNNAGVLAGLHQGFDRLLEVSGNGETLEHIVPNTIDTISIDRPVFMYIHILDPHGPYDPPAEHRRWFENLGGPFESVEPSFMHDPPWVVDPSREGRTALYDGEIEANDRALEALLENLDRRGWLENSLVIMASDHGEFLGEHGEWGHHKPGWPEVLHTPLIMIDPDRIPAGLVIEDPVQNLDLVPTILDLVGINPASLPFEGNSLAPLFRAVSPSTFRRRLSVSTETSGTLDVRRLNRRGSFAFDSRFVVHSPPVYHRVLDWREGFISANATLLSKPFCDEVVEFFQELHREHTAIAKQIMADDDQVVAVDAGAVNRLRALGYVATEAP